MSAKHVYMDDLHFNHMLWLRELDFFKEELVVLQKRLEEVASRNTDSEMKSMQERFQNKIIRQNEVIDELKHDIKIEEEKLIEFAKDHPVALNHIYFTDHVELKEKMSTFKDIYARMKSDFQKFVSIWL